MLLVTPGRRSAAPGGLYRDRPRRVPRVAASANCHVAMR